VKPEGQLAAIVGGFSAYPALSEGQKKRPSRCRDGLGKRNSVELDVRLHQGLGTLKLLTLLQRFLRHGALQSSFWLSVVSGTDFF